jgi:hypothetical protein
MQLAAAQSAEDVRGARPCSSAWCRCGSRPAGWTGPAGAAIEAFERAIRDAVGWATPSTGNDPAAAETAFRRVLGMIQPTDDLVVAVWLAASGEFPGDLLASGAATAWSSSMRIQ